MEESLEQQIRGIIQKEILFGFLGEAAILQRLRSRFGEHPGYNEDGFHDLLTAGLRNRAAKSQDSTDFFRLAKAFDHLARGGILSVHRAGIDQQGGFSAVRSVMQEYQATGIPVRGFCFYHEEDLHRATDPAVRQLYLAFDSSDQNDGTAAAVAKDIVEVLRTAQFDASWSGNLEDRILIRSINWDKIPDANEWGPIRAVLVAERYMQSLSTRNPVRASKPWWRFW